MSLFWIERRMKERVGLKHMICVQVVINIPKVIRYRRLIRSRPPQAIHYKFVLMLSVCQCIDKCEFFSISVHQYFVLPVVEAAASDKDLFASKGPRKHIIHQIKCFLRYYTRMIIAALFHLWLRAFWILRFSSLPHTMKTLIGTWVATWRSYIVWCQAEWFIWWISWIFFVWFSNFFLRRSNRTIRSLHLGSRCDISLHMCIQMRMLWSHFVY